MLIVAVIIARVLVFLAFMSGLRLLIHRAFQTSLPLGFGLCALIVMASFLIAVIVDRRTAQQRAPRGSARKTVPPALSPPARIVAKSCRWALRRARAPAP